MLALYTQALKSENIKVLTVNPAQTSTPMTWERPDAEYIPEKMIQPENIADMILMTFRMSPNAFIEEITMQVCMLLSRSSKVWRTRKSRSECPHPALPS